MTSPKEVQYALELAKEEGWRPGIDDAECFYAADPTGFFVGELDGRKISTVSVVKYENRLAFVGLYIVEKPFRGQGFGLKTFTKGLASVDSSYNMGLDAVVEHSHLYERNGFRRAWTNRRYQIDTSRILATTNLPPAMITVKPIAEIDIKKVVEYDAKMFGARRHDFLKKWITVPHARGFAAVDSSGELLGYTVIRKIIRDGEGYKIAPLFADGLDTAHSLFRAAAEVAATSTPGDSGVVLDVPVDLNPQAVEMVEKLGGVQVFTTHRMYTNDMPDLPMTKTFGITSFELG